VRVPSTFCEPRKKSPTARRIWLRGLPLVRGSDFALYQSPLIAVIFLDISARNDYTWGFIHDWFHTRYGMASIVLPGGLAGNELAPKIESAPKAHHFSRAKSRKWRQI
jgi:hypothetical protein